MNRSEEKGSVALMNKNPPLPPFFPAVSGGLHEQLVAEQLKMVSELSSQSQKERAPPEREEREEQEEKVVSFIVREKIREEVSVDE